jgi:formate-dependent nitrite reductase cytochrome c552 subunit
MANFFPRSSNYLPLKILLCVVVSGTAATAAVWYYFTPKYTRVGYEPTQPVPFSHAIHVEQLGMDCRYCHSFVEVAAHSNVPTTQVCMNCHKEGGVQTNNKKLEAVRDSWESGRPVEWIQIHKTPEYVYFNHSVHVNRGVSCVSCHGKVNEMEVVYHKEPMSMAWCLDCHRNPEAHLRPANEVTNLNWVPEDGVTQEEIGRQIKADWNIQPPQNCSACHR